MRGLKTCNSRRSTRFWRKTSLARKILAAIFALVGAQNITVWGPVGPHHNVLQAAQPCAAACVAPAECIPGDSYKNFCVRRLTVTEVFDAVRTALATRP